MITNLRMELFQALMETPAEDEDGQSEGGDGDGEVDPVREQRGGQRGEHRGRAVRDHQRHQRHGAVARPAVLQH